MFSPFKMIAPGSACIIFMCILQSLWSWLILLTKQLEIKVYPRLNQNNRAHAVTACIGLCCHGAMHAVHACIMHWPVMSQADACTYCIRSKVSSLSRIYLYSSYFVLLIVLTYSGKLFIRLVSDADDETMSTRVLFLLAHSCINI